MTNLGAHSIDIVQWYLDLKGPSRVCSFGGRRALEDNGETPDVQDAIFEYANGLNLTYSIREVSAGSRAGSALEFFGTKGSLTIERPMLKITPDMRSDPANAIPQFKGHSAGGPQRVNKAPEPWTEAFNMKGSLTSSLIFMFETSSMPSKPVRRPSRAPRMVTGRPSPAT